MNRIRVFVCQLPIKTGVGGLPIGLEVGFATSLTDANKYQAHKKFVSDSVLVYFDASSREIKKAFYLDDWGTLTPLGEEYHDKKL